ncbi:DUF4058 family protein [Hassallia byssoidea VB512170]|uniref:DUF4058 family protein n=1 Tax=Hassallia byssoidea VB512170 TaxID=1304833 RepID=A0A846HHZ4_9CYAN|nr:DUF4058 family protein [Hassalia byssoidea]NEU76459.1 DUF4058 family protein [Hassalia byssoidea VB512170]
MRSPFPGMNPYLEQPIFWSEFHSRLIVAIADALAPKLLPKYYIGVETRTYLEEVKERYLEVRETKTDAVITVIEILSPKNKRKGKGRSIYEQKRHSILGSMSHLVEIDLLRADEPMAMKGVDSITDYRIVVSQHERRPIADLYAFTMREAIPEFLLPLKEPQQVTTVNLQSIVSGIYERGGYAIRIDYQQAVPTPTLSQGDRRWVEELLALRCQN